MWLDDSRLMGSDVKSHPFQWKPVVTPPPPLPLPLPLHSSLCRLKEHISNKNNNPILIFPEGKRLHTWGRGRGAGEKNKGNEGYIEGRKKKKREKEGREGSCIKICYVYVMFMFWACLIGNWPSIWPTKTVALWTLIAELYPLTHLLIGLFRKWHASRKRIARV